MSIYGRGPIWGQTQPIGIGHGGDGDPEYRTREANDSMLGDRQAAVRIPECLTLRQYLDIVEASQGD